jgi:hypothetical protein
MSSAHDYFNRRIADAIMGGKASSLIRTVDSLHDMFGSEFDALNLTFPEIVTIGTESVGKSSL